LRGQIWRVLLQIRVALAEFVEIDLETFEQLTTGST